MRRCICDGIGCWRCRGLDFADTQPLKLETTPEGLRVLRNVPVSLGDDEHTHVVPEGVDWSQMRDNGWLP